MSKSYYRVRGIDLDLDGKRFPEGARIELDDDVAASLKQFLEPWGEEAKVEKTKAEEAKAEETKKADPKGAKK